MDAVCSGILNGVYKPGQKLPTEGQLARDFNASRSTVVRAMEDLQQQEHVIRYQGVGTFVRQQQRSQNHVFAVILHWQSFPDQIYKTSIFDLIVPEISRCASLLGCCLLLINIPPKPDHDIAKRVACQLIASNVSGVFLIPLELSEQCNTVNREMASGLEEAGITVVLLDRDVNDCNHRSPYDLVGIDNRLAMMEVTNHLLQQGCRKIDFFAETLNCTATIERIRGYKKSLDLAGIAAEDSVIHCFNSKDLFKSDPRFSQQKTKLLNHVIKHKVDAFVCANDVLAADLLNFLHSAGLQVPEDVRITGFDDLPLDDGLAVPLTTVRQPTKTLAYEAVRTMIDRLGHPDLPPRDIRVHAELIRRQSSGIGLPGRTPRQCLLSVR